MVGGAITTSIVPTQRSETGHRQSSQQHAAEQKPAIKLPWKTLRVSHFRSARLRLAEH